MLVRIAYVSQIVGKISDLDMQVILGSSQVNNRRLDITGVLARSESHFFQVLEGRRAAVDAVMSRVVVNSRHVSLRTVREEEVVHRKFPHWAMGFLATSDFATELEELHQGKSADVAAMSTLLHRLSLLGNETFGSDFAQPVERWATT